MAPKKRKHQECNGTGRLCTHGESQGHQYDSGRTYPPDNQGNPGGPIMIHCQPRNGSCSCDNGSITT